MKTNEYIHSFNFSKPIKVKIIPIRQTNIKTTKLGIATLVSIIFPINNIDEKTNTKIPNIAKNA